MFINYILYKECLNFCYKKEFKKKERYIKCFNIIVFLKMEIFVFD